MPKTWYTHPPQEFDSFYFFNEETRKFVRIRLELKRKDGSGDTKAMYEENRYVGFTTFDDLDVKDTSKWTVTDEGKIKCDHKVLRNEPRAGDWIYDFSLPSGEVHPNHVHNGNTYLTDGDRPPGITEEDLVKLALVAVRKECDVILTGKNATPEDLSKAILRAIGSRELVE